MTSNIQNNLKLLKLVLVLKPWRLLSKTPMQIVTLLLLVFRIHGFFVARVISRHRKMYAAAACMCVNLQGAHLVMVLIYYITN